MEHRRAPGVSQGWQPDLGSGACKEGVYRGPGEVERRGCYAASRWFE